MTFYGRKKGYLDAIPIVALGCMLGIECFLVLLTLEVGIWWRRHGRLDLLFFLGSVGTTNDIATTNHNIPDGCK
ncbi:hypothetical protein EVB99_021 [Rhizobium phage RHph_N3_19]|nr:hypothetical protein EVB99_021 [Rhizobium phage RHph_N3_19]